MLLGLSKSGSSIKFSRDLFFPYDYILICKLCPSVNTTLLAKWSFFAHLNAQMTCFWYFEKCKQVFKVKHNSNIIFSSKSALEHWFWNFSLVLKTLKNQDLLNYQKHVHIVTRSQYVKKDQTCFFLFKKWGGKHLYSSLMYNDFSEYIFKFSLHILPVSLAFYRPWCISFLQYFVCEQFRFCSTFFIFRMC